MTIHPRGQEDSQSNTTRTARCESPGTSAASWQDRETGRTGQENAWAPKRALQVPMAMPERTGCRAASRKASAHHRKHTHTGQAGNRRSAAAGGLPAGHAAQSAERALAARQGATHPLPPTTCCRCIESAAGSPAWYMDIRAQGARWGRVDGQRGVAIGWRERPACPHEHPEARKDDNRPRRRQCSRQTWHLRGA